MKLNTLGAASIAGVMLSGFMANAQETQTENKKKPAQAGSTQLDESVITAVTLRSAYTLDKATNLLKLGVPLDEVPQSVAVIPAALIRDQAAVRIEDVYRNVSGVSESGNTLNAQSHVFPNIRGFEADSILRNGMRATQIGTVDLFNTQSVEVLKGPASILFGALDPGGVISYTTKKPLGEKFFSLKQTVGSYDFYRTEFDWNTPLGANGNVLLRVNGVYQNSQSFRDVMEIERFGIAPSLLWKISSDTELGFYFSYVRETQPYDSGVPLSATGRWLVPDSKFFGSAGLNGRTLEDYFAGMELNHQINENLKLRSRLQYHRAEPGNESIRHRGVRGAPGAETLRRRYQNESRVDQEWQFTTDLLMNYEHGGVEHNAVFGFDYVAQESQFDRFRQNLPSIVIADPVPAFTRPANSSPLPSSLSEVDWLSLYAHDQISLFDDRLHILIGGRYDESKTETRLPSVTSRTDRAFTGRAGILYKLTPFVSPYTSVSQSFIPQIAGSVDRSGTSLDPETGLQFEAGFKFNLLDDRLQATLAFYQLEKDDVAVFDFAYWVATGNQAWLPGVSQRSRGIELDVTGKITDQLKINANYAYTDTEEIANATDPSRLGARLGNIPLHALRVWLAYDFAESSKLHGLGFGAGFRYEGERTAQFSSTPIGDYLTFDAGVWYETELSGGQKMRTQLNLTNLTDERYVSRASGQDIAHPGAPLGAMLSVKLDF